MIDSKPMECFLYDRDLRHERVKSHKISLPGLLYFKLFICLPYVKKYNFPGPSLPEPPPRLRHEPTAELAEPPDPHLHFTIIPGSPVMK